MKFQAYFDITEFRKHLQKLIISNKISINKNKQIFFSIFPLFFSIDIFYFPTTVGTEGHLYLRKFNDIFGRSRRKACHSRLRSLPSGRQAPATETSPCFYDCIRLGKNLGLSIFFRNFAPYNIWRTGNRCAQEKEADGQQKAGSLYRAQRE